MDIYYACVNQPLIRSGFEAYLEMLPLKARNKIARFHHWQDAQASLFGFLLLGNALDAAGYTGSQLIKELHYDGINKPRLSLGLPSFSISHAGDLVVCAISSSVELGIDIEQIKKINTSDFDNCWCTEEKNWLNEQEELLPSFFYLWTRKEAVLKGFGKGLSFDLQSLNVLDRKVEAPGNGTWYLQHFHIHESYSGHIAYSRDFTPDLQLTRLTY